VAERAEEVRLERVDGALAGGGAHRLAAKLTSFED
jgi:hypothetical protein